MAKLRQFSQQDLHLLKEETVYKGQKIALIDLPGIITLYHEFALLSVVFLMYNIFPETIFSMVVNSPVDKFLTTM